MRYNEIFETDNDTLKLPDIKVNDVIMVGKFKNRKATVKGFKKDNYNQPVLKTNKGDQKLFKPRIVKLMSEARITTWYGSSITVVHNPSKAGFERLCNETGSNLRGLLSFDGRDIWLWDGMSALHTNVMQELGLDRVECLYYRNGHWRGPNLTDENTGLYVPAIQRITPKKPFDDDALMRHLGIEESLMEATVKLRDIYDEYELRDESEILSSYIYDEDLNRDFVIHTMTPAEAKTFTVGGDNTPVVVAFKHYATKDQKRLVRDKAKNYDHDRIIVVINKTILDGNHQLMAGIMAKQPIKYIDLADI